MVPLFPADISDSSGMLQLKILDTIVEHYYVLSLEHLGLNHEKHYCSVIRPCRPVLSVILPLLNIRLVSSAWNQSILRLAASHPFFRRIEDAYYPHLWHINTRVRRGALLRRYRVYHTISTETGDRGVFRAYDFGGPGGCLQAAEVVIKAWTAPQDRECVTETRTYRSLHVRPIIGIPAVLASAYDVVHDVYAIVIQNLGPTLEDLLQRAPNGRCSEKVVLAVAVQMLDRYKDMHARGVVHNGVKPANICLPPKLSQPDSVLYAIDFGLSYELDQLDTGTPLPQRIESVGSRRFMSILGHLGMSHSQRDDLESLAYLLSLLHHGSLPWDRPYVPLPRVHSFPHPQPQSEPHLWRRKMAVPATVLFAGMDPAYIAFWNEVKGLAYGEVPDYERLKEQFSDIWRREGWTGDVGVINWWGEWERMGKVDAVNDLFSAIGGDPTTQLAPEPLVASIAVFDLSQTISQPLPTVIGEHTFDTPPMGIAAVSVVC